MGGFGPAIPAPQRGGDHSATGRVGRPAGRRARAVLLAIGLVAAPLGAVLASAPAAQATSGPPTIANGYAAYVIGSTSPPTQFNVLTLVTGGASSVNPSSLYIVSQPSASDGTVSIASDTSTLGLLSMTPASTASGAFSVTFAYCAPTYTYPNASECSTAELTYEPATGQDMGDAVTADGVPTDVYQEVYTAAVGPTSEPQGGTFTVTIAPAPSAIPSTESTPVGTAQIVDAWGFTAITPIPAGLTYVAGSVTQTGGDSYSSNGNTTVMYCTASSSGCTANIDTGSYKTTYPYIETQVSSSVLVAGSQSITLPTVSVEFTATGSVGTQADETLTELVTTSEADVPYLGDTDATFDGYPTSGDDTSETPPYADPTPLASTTITAPAPVVTGVSPSSGPTAGGTTVTITGSDLSDATAVDFGGTSADIVSDSDTSITATSPAGSAGTVDVTVTNADGTSATSSADQFTYEAPAPTVTGVSPSSGTTDGGTSVTVTGTDFTGATAVDFGGTPASSFTVEDDSTISATSPAGSAGTVDVTVTTPSGTSDTSAADQYTYVTPAPTVTALSPSEGTTAGGTMVTITGTDLGGATAVDFGGTSAAIVDDTATSITATSPAESTGTVDVTVTTAAGTSATSPADQYTYTTPPPAPTVTAVSPTNGSTDGGTTVTVTGTDFTGATAVDFGGNPAATFTVESDTTISATSPSGSAGTVDVTVTTPSGTSTTSAADQYTYVTPAPTVTALSPSEGTTAGGTSVTITGTDLTGATAVDFGGTPATGVTVVSGTEVTATSPAESAGTVDVTVTTPSGTSATSPADQYTYTSAPPPAPTVTAVSPSTGTTAGGTSVTITGTNLTGATAVHFGGTPATGVTVVSGTEVTATSPAESAGTVDVTVTTPSGTSTTSPADEYTYTAPPAAPTVSAVSPSSGSTTGGTSVTITGTDFTGATAVAFGGAAASTFTVESATTVDATSPPGTAGTVDVTVTTSGGTSATSAADEFTYQATGSGSGTVPPPPTRAPGAPTITGVAAGAGQLTVSFTAPSSSGSSPVTSYTVSCDTPGSAAVTAVDSQVAAGTLQQVVTGLTGGVTYSCTVTAFSATGIGPASAPASGTPEVQTLGPPLDVTAAPANGGATLRWEPPAQGTVAAYLVGMSPACPACTGLLVSGTSTTVIGLPNGTTTELWVAAVGTNGGIGTPSAHVSVVPSPTAGCPASGVGVWLAHWNGSLVTDAIGTAPSYGSMAGRKLDGAMVGVVPAPGCTGYWEYGADGGVFTFGNATFYGSAPANRGGDQVVAMAATPDGHGYWLATADGAVLTFGDAGSLGAPDQSPAPLAGRVVAMAATPDGHGYWLTTSTGAVDAYGDAANYGSLPADHVAPNGSVVAMAMTPDGHGYWLLSSAGNVYAFGDAVYGGGAGPEADGVWTGIAADPGGGYWVVDDTGRVEAFGGAPALPEAGAAASPTWSATSF